MSSPANKSQPALRGRSTPVVARPGFPAWLMAVLLALVTVALYWPVTHCDFVNYDDPRNVTENPHVQGGLSWEGVKWAFCNTEQAAYWAPLMWLSHLLACQLFGLNPWGHHLINVLLHAANTALVFVLFRRMTGAGWRSLMVAALFGLHPLRVESVAWVTERKDVLSTCFGLLALISYVRYAQERLRVEGRESRGGAAVPALGSGLGTLDYALALLFFALGLMSKAMLVTWPLVMLLLDYWPLRRFELSTLNSQLLTIWRLVREKIPFFVLAVVMSIVTFVTQKHGGAVVAVDELPLGARSGNALISYCRYLGKTFWPTDLAVFYPHPGHWPLAEVVLAGGVIVGISGLFFVQRRRYPFLLMGWLWFVGTLVPVIQLVQSGAQAMADRFTYVPSLGVLILVIWGAYELTRGWRYHVKVLSVVGSAAIVLCFALTRQQIGYWKDSEALFRHALAVTKNNELAHYSLGTALADKGQTDEAIRQYQKALRLNPPDALAHNNLGNALVRKGQVAEAIGQYQEALRLKPDYAEPHYNLGVVLVGKGQTDEAIRQFQEALRLKPEDAEAHYNLGNALADKGQIDEAIRQFQEAIRLKPAYAEAHNKLGTALAKKGQMDEAIRQLQEALRLEPEDAETHYNLGIALDMKGQTDEAIRQYQEAIRLNPDDARAHNNLGITLARKGRMDEAISQLQEAIRLKPEDALTHNNLGMAFYQKRQTGEAIGQFQEALRLKPDYAEARKNLDVALATKAGSPLPPGASTNR